VCIPRKEVIQPHLPVRLPCSRWSPRRREAWTISSPLNSSSGQGVRRVVSEGSRGVPSDFPADRPHRSDFHFHPLRRPLARSSILREVPSDSPEFPANSQISVAHCHQREVAIVYDFVPVANPTFDGCLLAVGPPASGVTDSHDVTGGVYKAREHIHRGVMTRGY
jgi:hypothetical protein